METSNAHVIAAPLAETLVVPPEQEEAEATDTAEPELQRGIGSKYVGGVSFVFKYQRGKVSLKASAHHSGSHRFWLQRFDVESRSYVDVTSPVTVTAGVGCYGAGEAIASLPRGSYYRVRVRLATGGRIGYSDTSRWFHA